MRWVSLFFIGVIIFTGVLGYDQLKSKYDCGLVFNNKSWYDICLNERTSFIFQLSILEFGFMGVGIWASIKKGKIDKQVMTNGSETL